MFRRIARLLAAFVMITSGVVVGVGATAGAAHADECYSWSRTLSQGASGSDVTQLQIRVAGWVTSGERLSYDGQYGARTTAAVRKFQSAYGLTADGIAGPVTFSKLYALQDADCTPVHFSYAELNRCNSDWSGGAVSAATAKANALKTMWKLEAMRHALGDVPLTVSSGFRSYACNSAVGGAAGSRHLYGDAADLTGSPSLCRLAQEARTHGFSEILGPGYPDHNDHAHVALDPSPTGPPRTAASDDAVGAGGRRARSPASPATTAHCRRRPDRPSVVVRVPVLSLRLGCPPGQFDLQVDLAVLQLDLDLGVELVRDPHGQPAGAELQFGLATAPDRGCQRLELVSRFGAGQGPLLFEFEIAHGSLPGPSVGNSGRVPLWPRTPHRLAEAARAPPSPPTARSGGSGQAWDAGGDTRARARGRRQAPGR